MAEVYGHKASFNTPLELLISAGPRERALETQWLTEYAEWLRNSEFGALICFVDVTFAPVGAKRANTAQTTLVITASDEQAAEYRRRLSEEFFSRGVSISAHPAFKKGLPCYRNVDGEMRMIATAADLSVAQKNQQILEDDGFLFWSSRGIPEGTRRSGLPSPERPFASRSDRTFPDAVRWDNLPTNIVDCWDLYTELFSAGLCAAPSGDPALDEIGVLVAAPVGIRDHRDRFIGVAEVYIGLSKRAGKADGVDFLRLLAVHLLRANAGFNQQVRGSRMLLQVIGHEMRKVTRPVTTTWIPRADDVFDVAIEGTDQASTAITPDKLGKVILKRDADFLKATLGIVPFTAHVRSVAAAMQFWSYSDYLQDLPFANESPKTWEALVPLCWDTARTWAVMYALSRDEADTPDTIHKTDIRIKQYEQLFDCQRLHVHFEPPTLADTPTRFSDTEASVRARAFAITRLLTSCFNNILQHGDFCGAVEVFFEHDPDRDDQVRLTVVNELRRSTVEHVADCARLDKAVVDRLKTDLKAVLDGRSELERNIGSSGEVVAMSLDALEGIELDSDRTETHFAAKFRIKKWSRS